MNDEFAKRVRSAAIAGWWTLLIVFVLITVQYVAYLVVMSTKPCFVLTMWGPDVGWPAVQGIWLWAIAVFKLCGLVMAMVVIWLSIWARRLGRQ